MRRISEFAREHPAMTTPSTKLRSRVATYSKNKLQLGLFGLNLSSGRSATKAPERWSGNWEDNLAAAIMADDAGMDFHLPVGRWKGYGGATNFEGAGFESTAWACGLLAQTKHMHIFATVHAPLVHPVFAAKQFVTADQIGRGRFGLNIVCGWNSDEFGMFGVQQREHDDRYAYGTEWIQAIYRMWEEQRPFDVEGEYLHLHAVEAEPKPFGGTRPIVMNAGSSEAGRGFALANCDMLFRAWRSVEMNKEDNAATTAAAAANGREVGVYTSGYVICRPTTKEALEYEHYIVEENADWEAIDHLMALSAAGNHSQINMPPEIIQGMRRRMAAGHGGFPAVGGPDDVAKALATLHEAGFAGFAFSHVNYVDEFPYFRQEVLPRLERMGLRVPTT
jgi:alkanesulfonate monooxygenase SsuD/methylene tetrahydromethanopterin reductase-like flavin-dependent oxidoreductase (luciferase family)